jgi:thiol-disulfide isomerase/thioredoxin
VKRNLAILFVVALTVGAMIYTAATKSHPDTGTPAVVGANLTMFEYKGHTAPDFELKSLDGKPLKLSSLRGKAVIVDFWATWCGPCKVEMPWLVELQKKYQDQGLVILGVAMDDTPNDDIAKFAKEMKVNYTILKGTDAVGDTYGGIDGMPITFYVGRDGKIIDKSLGLVNKSEIEENIQKALVQGGAAASAIPASNTEKPKAQ